MIRSIAKFIIVLPLLLVLAACATQPSQQDNLKDQVSTLRLQLLELQSLQNENRTKLDEAILQKHLLLELQKYQSDAKMKLEEDRVVMERLTLKVRALEEKQLLLGQQRIETRSSTSDGVSEKKSKPGQKNKAAKKKKKVRRQE